jgi:prepilin-type N-terminal cleavage/methylation domain-containing protein
MRTQEIKVKRAGGFTLIELLTVVAIIGLLVGMVVPTIKAVLENSQRMKLLARIGSLDNGAIQYKMSATGNRYYPGQDPEALAALTSGTNTSGKYPNCLNAGSVLLARCLFTDPNGLFPTSSYGQYEKDMLGTVVVGATSVPNSIIDNGSVLMAILYYPSRLGYAGVKEQYAIADNSKYVTAANSATDGGGQITIQSYVKPAGTTTTSVIRQDGLFVITAAGTTDRLYFSTTAVDNFPK